MARGVKLINEGFTDMEDASVEYIIVPPLYFTWLTKSLFIAQSSFLNPKSLEFDLDRS
jgi:hypothetical protein